MNAVCKQIQNANIIKIFTSLSTVVSKTSTLSFLVPFSPFLFLRIHYSFNDGGWKMKGKRESGFGGYCLHPADTWYYEATFWHLLHLWLHLSLFPHYILELLRTKTVFYTYYHFIFWTFWNSYISDNLLIPETRPWFLIQKICLLLESLHLAQRSSKLLRALSRFLLIIFSSLKLCKTIPLL